MTDNVDVLLPDRHPTGDLFICDVADAVLKDVIDLMEHPFFALSKKPDTKIRRYEHGNATLEVIPSVLGLPTIYDKDLLIYAISQVMNALNRGERVHRRVRIHTYDLLVFANRNTGGRDYDAMDRALKRLAGNTISTNIRSGSVEETHNFHLIESSSVKRTLGENGRLLSAELTLSDWVFDAIREKAVLTLHRDYFRLARPLERRIYELARKHCGQQREWVCGMDTLHKKSGSRSPRRRFSFELRELAETDHLPDYHVRVDGDKVVFINRGTVQGSLLEPFHAQLLTTAYDDARAAAPGWDPRYLESEWRNWCGREEIKPKNPTGHFIKFCRSWFEKRGAP